MIPSYQKKGKWKNGETKLIIVYYDDLGKKKEFPLPKASRLLNLLENLKNTKGIDVGQNPLTKVTLNSQQEEQVYTCKDCNKVCYFRKESSYPYCRRCKQKGGHLL